MTSFKNLFYSAVDDDISGQTNYGCGTDKCLKRKILCYSWLVRILPRSLLQSIEELAECALRAVEVISCS